MLSNGLVRGFLLGAAASAAIFYLGGAGAQSGPEVFAQTTVPGRAAPGESQPALRRGEAPSEAGTPAGVPFNPQGVGAGAVPIPGGIPAPYAVAGQERYWSMGPGDPQKGKAAIERYGCGSCHDIEGVTGADGKVGPPLNGVANRVYIAGVMRNNTVNMVRWIENPQQFVPNVVMPNLGVTESEARDIAAYLGTLR